ncbi:hypothetical protein [Phaeobacter inhibens]|uniref:hypothetical protein n=1 Tax=Phaeobacter inhibens TaxID=221822 RepID=UPI0020C7978F|nr:hypothetical protein [Phaeobacter inhibens]
MLEPLIRDRIAIAYPKADAENPMADLAGMAVWASGEINWLLDVIAPDQKATASVIAGFKQVAKQGDLRLHPIIGRLVDREILEKMGASQAAAPSPVN